MAKSAAAVVVLASSAVALGVTAAPAAASCNESWGVGTDTTVVKYTGGNLNLRYDLTTSSCSFGTIKSGHVLRYSCWWEGQTVNGHSTWTYLYDESLKKWGWASDAYLPGVGSDVRCSSVSGFGS